MSRNTIAKQKILDFIQKSDKAVSHADIQQNIGDLCDRVTIYRVLERLLQEDEIHKIVNTNGVLNYASCKKNCSHGHQHNHIHFSCEMCKTITFLPTNVQHISLPEDYVVKEIYFTVSGTCPSCR
jgi:Fur family ferric uptake transcriptional regulator